MWWKQCWCALLAAAGALVGCDQPLKALLPDAWAAWERGDFDDAREIAKGHLAEPNKADAARHMLLLCDFVLGRYAEALTWHNEISRSYPLLRALEPLVLDAHVHRRDIEAALRLARTSTSLPKHLERQLTWQFERPFAAELDGIAEIPFVENKLTEYFPGFPATINGVELTAHVDTGGTYIIMGPERAKALGIETIDAGTDRAHLGNQVVRLEVGVADTFNLGGVRMHDVPVDVLSSLTGESDFVIFGTNLLEPFLSTLDYPRKRLILSPRNNPGANEAHAALLETEGARIPFYLWSDHFMFARGGFGTTNGCNFFIDSGLVYVQNDSGGKPVQAAFTTSRAGFSRLGMGRHEVAQTIFPLARPIRLGALEQDGLYGVVGSGQYEMGGVRIDGLLSHAFLKRYAWTIDFDERAYIFRY
ncbi:MAG: aspartyl protease family protein [Candidatus Hydrogenedentes bacterium]|nr:aspartyl protease family protein [Candidatus Hydrogenedentota bacterium]